MKKLLIVLLVSFILGVALISYGAITGGISAFLLDGEGWHIENIRGEDIGNIEDNILKSDEITGLKEVDLGIGYADVEIAAEGDSYELYVSDTKNLRYKYDSITGRLEIKERTKAIISIFNFWDHKRHVVLKVPKGTELKTLNIMLGSGCCAVEGIVADEADIHIASGKANTVDCAFDEAVIRVASGKAIFENSKLGYADIDLASGKVEGSGLESESMKLRVASGKVDLRGTFIGKNRMEVLSGHLNMEIDGNVRDYNRKVSIASGSVKVNGDSVGKSEYISENAKNQLIIKVLSGAAVIEFMK